MFRNVKGWEGWTFCQSWGRGNIRDSWQKKREGNGEIYEVPLHDIIKRESTGGKEVGRNA